MDSAETRKLLKNAAWNGKIITTLADIIVMELIFSTQQICQHFIQPTPRLGCDELSRSSELVELLLRGKIQKKFLSGNFFERDDINFIHLMGCAFDCLITLIKIVGQNFVVGAIYPKNTFFGNKIAVLKSATVCK